MEREKDKEEGGEEWNLFARLESLEKELVRLTPTLVEVGRLSLVTFLIFFSHLAYQEPSRARQLKDSYIDLLKDFGLRTGIIGWLKEKMLIICDDVEK